MCGPRRLLFFRLRNAKWLDPLMKRAAKVQGLGGAEGGKGKLVSWGHLLPGAVTLGVFGRFKIEEAKFRVRQALCQVCKSQDGNAAASDFKAGWSSCCALCSLHMDLQGHEATDRTANPGGLGP